LAIFFEGFIVVGMAKGSTGCNLYAIALLIVTNK
jgi:hypothetical protein